MMSHMCVQLQCPNYNFLGTCFIVLSLSPELKGTEQIKAAFDKFFSSTKVSTNVPIDIHVLCVHVLIFCYSLIQESGKKLGDKFENFGDKLKRVGTR